MKSQSTKNPVRIIPCGALFESYGQTLDPSKYARNCLRHSVCWRKGWDSNPRYGITVYRISSPAHSTSLPPFRVKREDGLYLRLQEKARPPTEKSIPVFDGLSISGRASVHYFAAGTIFSLPFM